MLQNTFTITIMTNASLLRPSNVLWRPFANFRAIYECAIPTLLSVGSKVFYQSWEVCHTATSPKKVQQPSAVHLLRHPERPLSECQVLPRPLTRTMKADDDGEKAAKVAFKKKEGNWKGQSPWCKQRPGLPLYTTVSLARWWKPKMPRRPDVVLK